MNFNDHFTPEIASGRHDLQRRSTWNDSSLASQTAAAQSAAAQRVIQRSSRSFSLAVRFLPASLRNQVTSLYAWCRCVDDSVDRASDNQQAEQALQLLDEDLQRSVSGNATQHPASTWIQPLLANRSIEQRHASELIEGMRMDLRGYRVDTDADLERYCYHAAGTVGLMMTRLMGVTNQAADQPAIALGIAMQLTNIARDVREDAEQGRSYLPGIQQPLATEPREVNAAVAHILRMAEQHYRTAIEGLAYLPWNCRMAIRVALTVYREIGRQIARNGYEVLDQRTVVGKPRLMAVAMLAVIISLTNDMRLAVAGLNKRLPHFFKELTMNDSSSSQPTLPLSTANQAKQIVYLGLSLTLIMATALFAMVFVHPKSSDYSLLPLFYAGGSLLGSVLFHRLSARCDRNHP